MHIIYKKIHFILINSFQGSFKTHIVFNKTQKTQYASDFCGYGWEKWAVAKLLFDCCKFDLNVQLNFYSFQDVFIHQY